MPYPTSGRVRGVRAKGWIEERSGSDGSPAGDSAAEVPATDGEKPSKRQIHQNMVR